MPTGIDPVIKFPSMLRVRSKLSLPISLGRLPLIAMLLTSSVVSLLRSPISDGIMPVSFLVMLSACTLEHVHGHMMQYWRSPSFRRVSPSSGTEALASTQTSAAASTRSHATCTGKRYAAARAEHIDVRGPSRGARAREASVGVRALGKAARPPHQRALSALSSAPKPLRNSRRAYPVLRPRLEGRWQPGKFLVALSQF